MPAGGVADAESPPPRLAPHQVAPPAAGWAPAEGLWGGLEEKGLSVGVHIWEPLAHSCRLSACLRMDLDGTGRAGRGGRFAPADGNPDARGRPPAQRAGRGRGGAARRCAGTFPCAGPQGSAPRTPGWACLTSPRLGAKAGETIRRLQPRPGCATRATGGQSPCPLPAWGSLCKAGPSDRWVGSSACRARLSPPRAGGWGVRHFPFQREVLWGHSWPLL